MSKWEKNGEGFTSELGILGELLRFLWIRKLWWKRGITL